MTKRKVKQDGSIEIVPDDLPKTQTRGAVSETPEGAPKPEPEPQQEKQPEDPTPPIIMDTTKSDKPMSRATGAPQGQGVTHFQKLASSTGETLNFTTEEELHKYNEDVRTVNNMQLQDPVRFQAEYGYWPRRGDTTVAKRGLSPQDQDDVITAKKKLEGPDDKGNYKAVSVK